MKSLLNFFGFLYKCKQFLIFEMRELQKLIKGNLIDLVYSSIYI